MNFQARLMHHKRGLFDQSVNESYELILRDYLVLDFVQRWWSFARELYGAAFRDHCDALIEELARGELQPVADWTAYARTGKKD